MFYTLYVQDLYKSIGKRFRKIDLFVVLLPCLKSLQSTPPPPDTRLLAAFPRLKGFLFGGFWKVLKGTHASFLAALRAPC